MAIERITKIYDGPGGPFEGVVAYDSSASGARPGVMILPNVYGQKEWDSVKAEELAALGYVGFVVDIYGQGKRPVRGEPNITRYMDELNDGREVLRDRLHDALSELKALPQVDPSRTAAIGYCFGAKAALDLARSGADISGVVSFHAGLERPAYPNVTPIKPKVLICHGWDDPLAVPDAAVAIAHEMTESGADWQMHVYGGAGHGFTDINMNQPQRHIAYNADADRRSWKAALNFFEELFA
jgi:dienelactone hydrolase